MLKALFCDLFYANSDHAHNEQMKHISTSLANLGIAVFAAGVITNLIENGRSVDYKSVGFYFILWLVLFVISAYIMANSLIFPEEEDANHDDT
ncbi:hypothetical protein LO749_16800 [Paracoccus denitrificans]|uniref:hypothetical protein n=1 Tax=Paracoccus denitrificans TaxID=266 RepID=UPI001E4B4AEC|nr:hypothetical protein [Paracoccus denitrificans]UFS67750.1 hypothetical protein LO749_16800 [Paracoccus denitrificans]